MCKPTLSFDAEKNVPHLQPPSAHKRPLPSHFRPPVPRQDAEETLFSLVFCRVDASQKNTVINEDFILTPLYPKKTQGINVATLRSPGLKVFNF